MLRLQYPTKLYKVRERICTRLKSVQCFINTMYLLKKYYIEVQADCVLQKITYQHLVDNNDILLLLLTNIGVY